MPWYEQSTIFLLHTRIIHVYKLCTRFCTSKFVKLTLIGTSFAPIYFVDIYAREVGLHATQADFTFLDARNSSIHLYIIIVVIVIFLKRKLYFH
jgi:hypothetical protein